MVESKPLPSVIYGLQNCSVYPSLLQKEGTSAELFLFFFKKDFIYLFLERGEGKETEGERNINVWLPLTRPPLGTWPETQACALTENRTGNTLVGSQAHSQYTELH